MDARRPPIPAAFAPHTATRFLVVMPRLTPYPAATEVSSCSVLSSTASVLAFNVLQYSVEAA